MIPVFAILTSVLLPTLRGHGSLELVGSAAPPLELVESAPIETTLDHAEIRNASEVWLEMVGGAMRTLEFAEFYASDAPGSKLAPIVDAIVAAAARGVRVRFLLDEKFVAQYPEIPERFGKVANVEVRKLRLDKGVLHAKYFIVDRDEAYLGSQNFDWRSLEHIQELGVRVRVPNVVDALSAAFDDDWRTAGGEAIDVEKRRAVLFTPAWSLVDYGGAQVSVWPACDPKELVSESAWELPRLVAAIDAAKTSVRVQLLTYKMTTRDKSYWPDLENALRRAAARGARVQLLLADWCKRKGTIEALQALEPLENVEVKLVTIPQCSGGFVPFARVCHAKYMVVDGKSSWIGTSNWERDYFHESRNVGLFVDGAPFAKDLERFFADGWSSSYAVAVDPCAHYEAPRIDK